MQTEEIIRVAIVEDDRAFREGLGMIISATAGYECSGKYYSVEEALRLMSGAPPDVLLLDIHLPGMLGSEGALIFHERYPDLPILMLTIYDGQDKVFESICNGACGYLLKKTPPAKLLDAIQEAHQGGAPMSPEIARKVITLFQQSGLPKRLDEPPLTPQETRILKFLSEGYSYQNTAAQLDISINTVRTYIRSIYEKLHVNTRSEAVGKALRHRLIQ